MRKLHFEDRDAWRAWLEKNHERTDEVWLVFHKKHTGRATVEYGAAVEEALCFGWIDSLVRRLDDDRYARKFTPRRDTRKWSESNLRRLERMKAAGRMTEAGLAKVAPDVTPVVPPTTRVDEVPSYFEDALAGSDAARRFFDDLAPSYRRQFIAWVGAARRPETRRRRLAEAVRLLESGQKLGMK